MSLSVKNKIFFIFIIVIVASVGVVGWFGFKSAKESYINSAISINKGETKALSNELKGSLGTIPQDVEYNANLHALEKLIVWTELKDKRKIEYWKNVYVSAVKDYMSNKKSYYQIRILNINGDETLQFKYNEKTDTIIEMASDSLENKAHRDYFKETMKLKKGELYISEMTLNMINGKVEKPFVPVVRYATPLVDKNGETKGVIVINLNANNILNDIAATKAIDSTRDSQMYYLLNEEGYYLFIGDKSKRWGFQLGTEYNFKKDYKNVLENFKDKDEVTFSKDGSIFSMHKVYPNKIGNSERFWYLVTVISEDVALASLDTFVSIFFLISLVVLVSGLFLINWYISKIMDPLAKTTLQLKALSRGEIRKEDIVYKADDEIGQIVNSTAILINAIETTIYQANAVAKGDFTKEIILLGNKDALGRAIINMTKRLKEISNLASTLSSGNYDVDVFVKGNEDELGIALKEMVEYLKQIAGITESISVGELNVNYKPRGDDDRLGHAVLEMIEYLRSILKQADSITREEFTQSIEVKSKNDELGQVLVTMTDMLRTSSVKNKNEIYFSDGVGEFSDKLTGISDTIELSRKAITLISHYIKASSGVLYTFDNDTQELNLVASYAYVSRDILSNTFKLGEGIIGQVALEKTPILLKNIKDNDHDVQSGTTLSKPKEIYAFPLIHEGELFGVAEVVSFDSFSKINKDYLAKTASIFATALHTVVQNTKIKTLLEQSQKAFEELQVTSEELQESNVQMEEQQQQLTIQSEELKGKNDNLAKAKEEIDIRAEELEKASQYKNEFLANMSHELRTPLNSIILLSKLLTQNQNDTLNENDIEKSNVIHNAGNDLLLLINDILDLSKIESGNMELEYENIYTSDIIEDMKGLFNVLADDKKIDFIVVDKFDSSFSTDKTKLLQVLKNLLSNAFKFTKDGSVIMNISIINNEIVFEVKDTGIGIANDKLESIFDAFKQVDGSISREFGGTGLGLSISKTIVELMNGHIAVESKYEEGTSFIVALPLKEGVKIEKVPPVKTAPVKSVEKLSNTAAIPIIVNDEDVSLDSSDLSGKNILIVDDDSRNIFTLTSTLEIMEAEVYSAFNGQEAIEILESEDTIDLILMDIMMPVMNGLKAIENIKSNDNFKDIPIIAITAKTMPEDKQKCLDSGADDYLAKPLQHSALISMIKAWI